MILRPYEIEDAPLFASTVFDPQYHEYWRDYKGNLKRKDFENIEQILQMQIMTVKDEDKVIGFLTGQKRSTSTVFVSILILKEFQGKGYARKMITEGLKYLKDMRFHKVAIRINPENEKLIKLCKKIGFVEEGLFYEERWSAEGWRNELMLALIL